MRFASNVIKLIVVISLIIAGFVVISFVAGRLLSPEAQSLAELKATNNRLTRELARSQEENANLKEANARLQADVEGGRTVEEERRLLEERSQNLDAREERIAATEAQLTAREEKLRQSEQEFFNATNLTQQEIGQAMQIRTEYEAMRQARDEALQLANRWLMFFYGISIAAVLLILTVVVLAMRYWAISTRYRGEAEQRRQVLVLLSKALDTNLSPAQSASIAAAIRGITAAPQTVQHRLTDDL